MKKSYVLYNPDDNKYYTGRYWDGEMWTRDFYEAKEFDSEEALLKELGTSVEHPETLRERLIATGAKFLEVKTIIKP